MKLRAICFKINSSELSDRSPGAPAERWPSPRLPSDFDSAYPMRQQIARRKVTICIGVDDETRKPPEINCPVIHVQRSTFSALVVVEKAPGVISNNLTKAFNKTIWKVSSIGEVKSKWRPNCNSDRRKQDIWELSDDALTVPANPGRKTTSAVKSTPACRSAT